MKRDGFTIENGVIKTPHPIHHREINLPDSPVFKDAEIPTPPLADKEVGEKIFHLFIKKIKATKQ